MDPQKKTRVTVSAAWREARELVWAHRRRLVLGRALMLISRLAGLVLPASSKWLIDDVVGAGRTELLMPIALAVAAATVQRVTCGINPNTATGGQSLPCADYVQPDETQSRVLPAGPSSRNPMCLRVLSLLTATAASDAP
jgi:hypothetical protein